MSQKKRETSAGGSGKVSETPGHGETQLAEEPTSVSFSPTFQLFVVVLLTELNGASRSDTENPVKL